MTREAEFATVDFLILKVVKKWKISFFLKKKKRGIFLPRQDFIDAN